MSDDPGSVTPIIDRAILADIRDRLRSTEQFAEASIRTIDGQIRLVARLDTAYYPGAVEAASLDIRWYSNDDFRIHYREKWSEEDWQQRWDRHPNPHNSRAHFHPPPDARTPGDDATWPADYWELMRDVLEELERRIIDLW